MEKTVKKLLVATGLVTCAAVALLPLTSYAVEAVPGMGAAAQLPPNSDYFCDTLQAGENFCASAITQQNAVDADGNPTGNAGPTIVTVNVDTVLAIDAVSLTCVGENDTCVNTGKDSDGNDVKAIQAYPGMVRTGALTARVRSAKPFTISISAEDPYLKGYDASGDFTGYVIPSSSLVDGAHNGWGIQKDGAYTGVTSRPTVFLTSETPQDEFGNFNFEVGVSATDTIPQGLYSTEVTVTAATIGTN